MSWEPPLDYVVGFTKAGTRFRGLSEQLPRIVKAMEEDDVICIIDIDDEEVFLRGSDIDILYVSTLQGRDRMGEFTKMLEDEGDPEWKD